MSNVYAHANGYGTIDTHSEPFQVGRRLYETQVLFSEIDRVANGIHDPLQRAEFVQKTKNLCHWYCELVQWMGQLRADYNSMLEIVNGRAEWEGADGIRRRMTRMD